MKPWLFLAGGLLALLVAISWLTSEPLRPDAGVAAGAGGKAGLVPALPDERADPKGRERKPLPMTTAPPRLDRAHFEALSDAKANGKPAAPAPSATVPAAPAPQPTPPPAPQPAAPAPR
jgi:hypothetical protein